MRIKSSGFLASWRLGVLAPWRFVFLSVSARALAAFGLGPWRGEQTETFGLGAERVDEMRGGGGKRDRAAAAHERAVPAQPPLPPHRHPAQSVERLRKANEILLGDRAALGKLVLGVADGDHRLVQENEGSEVRCQGLRAGPHHEAELDQTIPQSLQHRL